MGTRDHEDRKATLVRIISQYRYEVEKRSVVYKQSIKMRATKEELKEALNEAYDGEAIIVNEQGSAVSVYGWPKGTEVFSAKGVSEPLNTAEWAVKIELF